VLTTPGGARVNVYDGSTKKAAEPVPPQGGSGLVRPPTPPEVIARRLETAERITKRWSERTRGNPSAGALSAAGGWEDDPEEDEPEA
jgi:hypothetical protein